MGETTTVTTPDGDFSAYVARPTLQNAPAIVVLQEIFGVNAVMRTIADQFAAAGYLAICPDLFWRIEPGIDISDHSEAEWKRAFELYNAFDVDVGINDIAATVSHIREDPNCSGRVGAVGFCLGGLLAYLTATRTNVDASASYYGVGIDRYTSESGGLNTPILLHIAEEDQFVSKPAQTAILSALQGNPLVEIYQYPGQDHAFARVGGEHYNPEAAQLAWDRTLSFFERPL